MIHLSILTLISLLLDAIEVNYVTAIARRGPIALPS